ncbi:class I SAM-dependent RNA methyltransferase [Azospirillum picis]|uniref:23S rRNA (Uracil1939-C5)-methyltransferase n=1 Tax=Azospirillum picis TaxID=488438 RepID=A0ABU0MQV8_9PROT|nr:methyltransferase [Azospirillum picis]MBP2301676.1 23S rRNA (uracil1939-C5)-methyltransferase [Azospirillum picis]MDQ0535501.1 23S rRNA (uracil1939-C5)-methyltransferase [Azospirillum picis]
MTRPAKRSVPNRRQPSRASAEAREVDVVVTDVGARGDGIAQADGLRLFVPYTVTGDHVRVRVAAGAEKGEGGVRADVVEILAPGPGRRTPPCRHFGRCGGCTLQHMDEATYAAWNVGLVRGVLERAGLSGVPLEPLSRTPPGARRRARFAALKRGGRVWFGFNERQSHRLVDLEECPVLSPRLFALVDPLRRLLTALLPDGGGADLVLTDLEGGADLLLVGPRSLDLAAREALVSFEPERVARIAWQPTDRATAEPVANRRPAFVRFAGVPIQPPSGAFLQASADGEAALVAAVREGVGEAGRIADLFAGIGTFSVPLAQRAAVHAVEGDDAAVTALARAVQGLRLTVERRDLFENPLTVKELNRYDAVVFDPPRAGAAAQAAALAGSRVPRVVGVSCNPASFARDARVLADGGFRLVKVWPVDQFLWSAHVELVGLFER